MFPDFHTWLFVLGQFFQAGGWVLYLIFAVCLLLATLILERISFRFLAYPGLKSRTTERLITTQHPAARRGLLCDLDLALSSQFSLIKSLITLCPLIGLLGTVTGMIQVFDALALYGTGNPRLMAAGVASATLPTMTGMAIAVAGLLFYNRLIRWSENERLRLKTVLYQEPTR